MKKIEHILFPIDLSATSHCVVPFVQKMAVTYGARVTVFSALEIPVFAHGSFEAGVQFAALPPELENDWNRNVASFTQTEFAGQTFPVDYRTVTGTAATAVIEFARENAVDLIMMATHGAGPMRRFLLGSTSAKVLHDAQCPVWTAAHASEAPWLDHLACKKVLCAVDLSNKSESLVRSAVSIAQKFSAELRLVYTIPHAESRPEMYFETDFRQALVESAEQKLQDLKQRLGIDVPHEIRSESIETAIRHAAIQHHSDLIVIGRGHLDASFGRLRTHSYAIIRESPCPVVSL